jgi:hypothetical protein
MLCIHNFREAAELRKRGTVEIPLPDDNAAAMLTVLRVVHGRFAQVPESPAVPELYQIAVIVDKYAFHEPLRLQSDKWLDALERAPRPMPYETHDIDFLTQLSIFWAFGRQKRVQELAQLAARGWDRPFDTTATPELPGELLVPAEVFGKALLPYGVPCPCPSLALPLVQFGSWSAMSDG